MSLVRRGTGSALVIWACLGAGMAPLEAQEPLSWGEMQREIREMEPSPATRISYGSGPLRFGELRLPGGPGPHPVAIVIHGGCWLSIADLSYVRPLASELVEAGWATWTLEFNRIDQAEGSWPGILQDVATGADHLLKIAGEYSLDLERVAAVGHSSGGHLALWLSARSGAEGRTPPLPGSEGDPLAIRGVVGLAPVAGLEDFQARSDRCGSAIVARLVDSPPAGAGEGTPEASLRRESRLDATDPERMLPLGVAQLMIFGEEDGIVPPAHGVAWQGRVEEFGGEVEVRIVSGAGHFEVVAPWTASWPDVERPLRIFLSGLAAGV